MMKRLVLFLCILLLASGCALRSKASQSGVVGDDWPESTPQAEGMDAAVLDQMLAHVDDTGLNLHSLLVIRHGKIVLEKYYPGHSAKELHQMYSVTKSFVSSLVGICLDQGRLDDVDQALEEFFPGAEYDNPDPRKSSMTVANLLTMSSGLDWTEGDASYSAMYRSADWTGWVMGLEQIADPGEDFVYCSGCTHVLLKIVERVIGVDGVEFADEYLLKPIGITRYEWERTPQGDPIGGWGLYLTTRDMARLGYLYLHDGVWGDRQVITKDWIEAATTRHIATGGDLGYGYQWWIYPDYNAYAALGMDGQTIFVLPDHDIIVTTTAEINGHDPIFELIDNYIVPSTR